jgi:hypothetical protein
VIYSAAEPQKVERILRELGLEDAESIVLVDARSDNKPSASKGWGGGRPVTNSGRPAG